jgi:hypothetical protein
VHVFHANFAAVGVLQSLDEFSEFPLLLNAQNAAQLRVVNVEVLVQILLGQAVVAIVQHLVEFLLGLLVLAHNIGVLKSLVQFQRVQVSLGVAVRHEPSNQHHDLEGVSHCLVSLLSRGSASTC